DDAAPAAHPEESGLVFEDLRDDAAAEAARRLEAHETAVPESAESAGGRDPEGSLAVLVHRVDRVVGPAVLHGVERVAAALQPAEALRRPEPQRAVPVAHHREAVLAAVGGAVVGDEPARVEPEQGLVADADQHATLVVFAEHR